VHSAYFQVLSEEGLAGILLLGYVVFGHFRALRRAQKWARQGNIPAALRDQIEWFSGGLAGGMVGFLSAGAFLSVAYYPYLWYLAGQTVAVTAIVNSHELARRRARRPREPGER
jgi:hypothetical protein